MAILALRSRVDGVARPALAVAGVGMALFALAHVYTLVDVDTAILLFSVFLVVTAVALIVAGIALARTWRGPGRFVPLLCGVWPLATIPAGAALGDCRTSARSPSGGCAGSRSACSRVLGEPCIDPQP